MTTEPTCIKEIPLASLGAVSRYVPAALLASLNRSYVKHTVTAELNEGDVVAFCVSAFPKPDIAEIVYVWVRNHERGKGIAARLICFCESKARVNGAKLIRARFRENLSQRLARLCARCGWSKPELLSVHLEIPVDAYLAAAQGWNFRADGGRAAFSGFRFTPEDEARLRGFESDPRWARSFSPRPYLSGGVPTDQDCSLTTHLDGRLAGWVIAETVTSDEQGGRARVFYPVSFVDFALWGTAIGIQAFQVAIRRQRNKYGGKSIVAFGTHVGVPRMLRFVQKRVSPVATKELHVLQTSKHLA